MRTRVDYDEAHYLLEFNYMSSKNKLLTESKIEMDKKFTYVYSAKQNEEIKKIREKYQPPDEKDSKIEQLRKLDASVTNTAVAVSLTFGIIGSLILGFGMSCVMVWSDEMFVPGIIIGIVGIILSVAAYPIYKKTVAVRRKKIAPEILKITDELIK